MMILRPFERSFRRWSSVNTGSVRTTPPTVARMRRLSAIVAAFAFAAAVPSVAAAATGYHDAIMADSPAGYWQLDETAGTVAADSSGNGQNGQYVNAPLLGQSGGVGDDYGISLNGTSQVVNTTQTTTWNSAAFTFEVWVKPDPSASDVPIAATRPASNVGGWHFNLYGGKEIELALEDANNNYIYAISKDTLSADYWSDVAATYDGTRVRLYINGREVSYASHVDGVAALGQSDTLVLGGDGYGAYCVVFIGSSCSQNLWHGGIDDASYFPYALTATQIAAHYNAPTAGEPPRATTDVPTIAGSATEGATLTAQNGTWVGSPLAFDYQWERCDAGGGGCSDISGATQTTYVPAAADVGDDIRVRITGSNMYGSRAETTSPTAAIVGGASLGAYGSAVLSDTPLIFYRLDEDAGASVVADQSGNNRTGAVKYTVPLGSAGFLGGSASFDGTPSGWIESPYIPAFNGSTLTVEAWLKIPQPLAYYKTLAGTTSSAGNTTGWSFGVGGTSLEFVVDGQGGGQSFAIASTPLPVNQWVMATATWNGTQVHLYINGSEVSYSSNTTGARTITETDPLRIGTSGYGAWCRGYYGTSCSSTDFWQGGVDDVSVYDHVLSSSRIAAHWSAAVPPPSYSTPPKITGTFNAGETLAAQAGAWTNTDSLDIEWFRCVAGTCSTTGQHGSSYSTTSTDDGASFKIVVTGTNASASTTASAESPVLINETDLATWSKTYRPALLFDSSEHYRPITLDSFLSEYDYAAGSYAHKRCDSWQSGAVLVCEPVGTLGQLMTPTSGAQTYGTPEKSYLSIWPYGGDPSAYHTPPDRFGSPCPAANDPLQLMDCGDAPGIYYDYGQSANGYRFLDYWFFYRYNPRFGDEHEGDWEGVTVELNPSPGSTAPSVAGVVFEAHGFKTYRLAQALTWCTGTVGDCGVAGPTTHVADYIASGSHASYEYPCSSDCYNPATGSSIQPDGENSHDGTQPWLENGDDACTAQSCVLPMTYIDGTATPDWVTFSGRWGGSDGTNSVAGVSPNSPGDQDPFICTQAGWIGCTIDGGDTMPAMVGTGKPIVQLAATRAKPGQPFALGVCSNWYDTGLTAYACSQRTLTTTVNRGKLASRGAFTISTPGHHSGAAPGLVQVVGGPVRVGTVFALRGKPARDEVVILNCFYRRRVWAIKLSQLRMRATATAVIVVRGGRPTVRLRRIAAAITTVDATPHPQTVGG